MTSVESGFTIGHSGFVIWYYLVMQALYRWLWYLVPGNPMVVRIVQGGSRRLRHFWVRTGYLGVLSAVVVIGLLFGGGVGGEISLNELAKAGSTVFIMVSWGQVILICLLAPLFMAGAIAQERSGETYNILLTTPLTNLQIVLGSLIGRLFFVLALLFSGLPLFSVLLIFGGVPIRSVFVAFAVAALVAVSVGSVAVTLSVMRAGGRKAVFVFVISIAAYLVAGYAVDVTLLRQFAPVPGGTTWLTPLHPLLVLQASISTATYRPPSPEQLGGYAAPLRFYLSRPFAAFSVLSGLLSVVLVLWSALVLRQIGAGESRWRGWVRNLFRVAGVGGVERRRPPREVWANPVAWREAHTRGNGAGGVLARWAFLGLGLGLAAVLLLLYHLDMLPSLGGPGSGAAGAFHTALLTLLLVELAVIVMVAIYMSAGSVSREREDGTLDLMLTTPITPRFYIWGKLRGLVSFLGLMLATPVLTLVMVAAYTLIGVLRDWPQAMPTFYVGASQVSAPLLLIETPVLLVLMLVPFVALCVMVGMNWSLRAKGVLSAVVPAVSIVGAIALVTGFCGMSAAENIPLIGPVINAFSPATNLFMLVNPWEHVDGFAPNAVFGRVSLVVAAVIACGGYSLIVYGMLLGMVRGFDHTVRRLSGTG